MYLCVGSIEITLYHKSTVLTVVVYIDIDNAGDVFFFISAAQTYNFFVTNSFVIRVR